MNNILTAFAQTAEVKDVKEVVEETQRFFTMNDMRTILDKFIEWCASTVGTIVWALIVWVIGKKILKALLKVLGKALDRSRLDEGVTKFMLSLSRFAGNVEIENARKEKEARQKREEARKLIEEAKRLEREAEDIEKKKRMVRKTGGAKSGSKKPVTAKRKMP